jgi:MoaA/NifB/PqqE/SkfB family radical SAM enzyme
MEQYFKLPDNAIYQRTPDGATLYTVFSDENGWLRKKRLAVNRDGSKLLELCDGEKELGAVIHTHNKQYPDNIVLPDVASKFFSNACKDGLLESHSVRQTASTCRIAGSYTHYYPEHTAIELTSQCNYRCKHCYRGSSPENDTHIDYDILMQYLNEFYNQGGTVIELTGGEPLLYKRFFDVLEWSAKRFEITGILTNGYFLQDEAVEKLLPYKERLVLNISLDSHRPQFHNEFRGKNDAFEQTLNAIKLLGKHKFIFRVAMSVTKDNFFDMEDTLELARKHGATLFGYSPVFNFGRGEALCEYVAKESQTHTSQEYLDYELAFQERNKDFIHFTSDETKKALETGNCGIVHRSITIGPDGEVRPCVMFDSGFRLGNIHKQSFTEIFGGKWGEIFHELPCPKESICGSCKNIGYCKNCVLRGMKMGMEMPECTWLKKTGIAKYLQTKPAEKICSNTAEPYYG